jgi:hypothetical protein
MALLAGAATGAGVVMLAHGARPWRPDLGDALVRLSSTTAPRSSPSAGSDRWLGGSPRLSGWMLGWLSAWAARTDRGDVGRLDADLTVLGMTRTRFALRKLLAAVVGLLVPPLLTVGCGLVGVPLPMVLPVAGSLLLAGVMWLVPDVEVRQAANEARDALRRSLVVYLELVALERAADAGPGQALHRAAVIGDGPGFALIRDRLTHAQLDGIPAWQALAELADTARVAELADVADIMRLSGESGAAVYSTLRARAASLRTALLTTQVSAANAASERMVMPVALLGMVFLALLAFPAAIRLMTG